MNLSISQTVSYMPKKQLRQNVGAHWRSHRISCQSQLGVSQARMLLGVTSLGAQYSHTLCVPPLPPTAGSSEKECNPPAGRGLRGLISYVAESGKVQWKRGQSLEQVLEVQNKTLGFARGIKNERHQLLPQDTGFCLIFLVSVWSKVVLSCFCLVWAGFGFFGVFFAICGRKSNSLLVLHFEPLLQGYIVKPFLFPCTSWASLPHTLLGQNPQDHNIGLTLDFDSNCKTSCLFFGAHADN